MASRKLPGLGLNGFWNLGENWKEGGDENWLKLSVFTQLSVQSCTTQIPGSAPNGMIYIVPDDAPSEPNKLAVRDGGQWVYLSVPEGVRAWVKDVGKRFQFVGGSWQEVPESSDGIADAPVDGTFYTRGDEEWRKLVAGDNVEIDLTTPGEVVIKSTGGGSGGIPEAPNDDEAYLRRNQGWNKLVAGNNVQLDTTTPGEIKIDTEGGGGIPDAPDDGEPHVRIDEEWRKLVAGDNVEIDTTGTPGEVKVSATGGGSDYSAGDGIIIEDGEISTEVPIAGYGPIRSKIFRISVLETRGNETSVHFTGIGFSDLEGSIPTDEATITSPTGDPSVLLDGTSSYWHESISASIFTIIFPNATTVNFLRIRSGVTQQAIRCPRIVKLEISVDGLNFTDAGTYDLGTWGASSWRSVELESTIRVPLFIGEAPYDGEPHVRIDEGWRKLVAGDNVEIDTTGTPGEVIISVPEIGDISAALDAINGEVI